MEQSHNDLVTTYPKKIMMRDMLTVLKNDARMRNRGLVY